jgi:hypothetical protein
MKIDVEGGEMLVLSGAKVLLENSRPTVFLATHGRGLHQQCCELLTSFGYHLRPIGANNLEQADEILAWSGTLLSEGGDARE